MHNRFTPASGIQARLGIVLSQLLLLRLISSKPVNGLKLLQQAACLCAGLLLSGYLPAGAQTVASCQTTTAPPLLPIISDSTPGWSATTSAGTAKEQFLLGDIDGDGNDELVMLVQGQIQVWRWIQTGWSPMTFPNAAIGTNYGAHSGTITVQQLRLADIDGDGQKEIVVFMKYFEGFNEYFLGDREQIYHYNKNSTVWTMLTSYQTPYPSFWIKAHTTDAQATRMEAPDPEALGYAVGLDQFVNGTWTHLPGWGSVVNLPDGQVAQSTCTQTGGACVAVADVNGDGLADLVFLRDNGNTVIALSTAQAFFGGAVITSKIPAVPTTNGRINPVTADGWQMGDIEYSPTNDLVFPTPSGQLLVYYWDTSANDFAPIGDPNNVLAAVGVNSGTGTAPGAIPASYTIVPDSNPINVVVVSSDSSTSFASGGLLAIQTDGVYFYPFRNLSGVHSFVLSPFKLTSAISVAAGYGPSGYSGYFRAANEGNTLTMVARSANGIVNLVPGGSVPNPPPAQFSFSYVDPNTQTDRGYPAYGGAAMAAYQYISGVATGNSDIRSLYPDPAVPWAPIQFQVETMTAPAASSGISSASFKFVQKQTIAELTALQSVNLLYGVTGQILTNTYLVKDAALSEITDVLGLSPQPDVTGMILNDLSSAIGGLGAALEGAGVVLSVAETVSKLLNNAGTLAELLGTITGDIATYTAPQVPDLATGNYDLKTALDNSSLGALTANNCHQVATLSAWNQSKPVSDGILTGSIPLDLNTQQAILQASQALFQVYVWQALAPSKWSYVSVRKTPLNGSCGNCLFTGSTNYPLGDSVQASGSCTVAGLPALGPDVSLLLEDTSSNNYPNINALNALFNAPPNGLGAHPSDVFFGQNNWNIPYASAANVKFNANTSYTPYSCTNLKLLSPQVTPNMRFGGAPVSGEPAAPEAAGTRLQELLAEVKTNLGDIALRDRLGVLLESAGSRLRQARQHDNPPTEALRLLGRFIDESQWHAAHDFRDSEISRTESMEAVAIRDALIDSMKRANAH